MENKSKINQKQVNGDYYERNIKSFDGGDYSRNVNQALHY